MSPAAPPDRPAESPSAAALAALGWDEAFAAQPPPDPAAQPARVIFVSRLKCRIWLPEPAVADGTGPAGPEPWRETWAEVPAKLARRMPRKEDFPGVGDWVWVRLPGAQRSTQSAPRGKRTEIAEIEGVLTRKSLLARKAAGETGATQVLAANVDLAFVATSLNRDLNPRRLERYLTLLGSCGVPAAVVLTKADLADPAEAAAAEALVRAACPGVTLHAVSARTGQGLEGLLAELRPGRTLVLLGSSGVGKSTLINRLLGADALAVRAIRERDDRGRHTTTVRQMLRLPGGALIIDTPGMRELRLLDDTGGALEEVFADIEALAQRCRFRDCTHGAPGPRDGSGAAGAARQQAAFRAQGAEPGCAVWAAVEAGLLAPERLAGFHKLRQELAHGPARISGARRDDKSAETRYKEGVKRVPLARTRKKRQPDA